jgi:hypothetical protein
MATLPHPCFQKNKAKNVSEKIYTKKTSRFRQKLNLFIIFYSEKSNLSIIFYSIYTPKKFRFQKQTLCVFVSGCNMYTYEHLHTSSQPVAIALAYGKAILYPSPRFSAWPRSCRVRVIPLMRIQRTMGMLEDEEAMAKAKRKRSPRRGRDPCATAHVSNLALYT